MAAKSMKYGNRKTVVDGITFDSLKEASRYKDLKIMERSGQISMLTLQPKFTLVTSQRNADGKTERPVVYIGDFLYQENGHWIIEDVKGMKTPEYVIKRKLMLERHGITVREI